MITNNSKEDSEFLSVTVDGEYVCISKIQGLLDLDEYSSNYGVEVSPQEMLTIAKVMGQYNEYTPELATELVQEINRLIPPMQFQEGNPNNGHSHHKFKVGREGSRVLYLELVKFYLPPDFNYEQLTRKLERIAENALADEHQTVANSEHGFVYRIWWD